MTEPAQLNPKPDLAALAERINNFHKQVEDAGRNIIGNAIRAGLALFDAKKEVGHGNFLPWLKKNCRVSERRAQDYMKLATHRQKVEAEMKSAPAADFSLKWALGLLKDRPSSEIGALGKYAEAQKALLKKLSALEPEDVEDAANRTVAQLNEVVAAVTKPIAA